MTTEQTTVNQIGKVLEFNERGFVHAELGFKRNIAPKVQSIIKAWKALPFTETFSDEEFKDLTAYGIKNTKKRYEDMVRKDLKAFKTTYMLDIALAKVDEELAPLSAALDELHRAISDQYSGITGNESYVLLEEISIHDEAPVLDTDAVKRRYETRIETEKQATLYSLMMNLKEAHEALHCFLSDRGYDFHRRNIISDPHHLNGLMYEDFKTGHLVIDPHSINTL